MSRMNLKTTTILSSLIAILSIFASAGGILLKDVYRDNEFVQMTWLGNDWVTLLVAVPLLIASMVFTARGSMRAHLIWLGVLDYMLYNYAFYLFGAAFNLFFLVYSGILGLSIFALIFGLVNLNPASIFERFNPKTPVKWIGGYFLLVAVGLGVIYLAQSIGFIVTGELPPIIGKTHHPTNVVFALDLTLLIPWLVVGSIWMMKKRPWGYVVTSLLSVKGPLYTLVLAVNSVLMLKAGMVESSELPLWGSLTALGLGASVILYKNLKSISHN